MERNNWLGVELRHLAALAAVCRTGSFRGAADELGYVQSAVSQQIARLEHVIGVRLLERMRGHGEVTLTPAGEIVLEHAENIFARLRAAQDDLGRLAAAEREKVVRIDGEGVRGLGERRAATSSDPGPQRRDRPRGRAAAA
jgi:molybdate transport repressor ModE-like protein